ncbi:hypothetical protein ACO1O0_002128 [Amphichorda felina]
MAEQENFEEDLFADLYDDNDASKGAAPAPPPATAPAPVNEPQPDAGNQGGPAHDGGADGAEIMHQDQEEYDDDDDDVDFNLGGGSTSLGNTVAPREEAPTPPPYGTIHKASAKEDG